MRKSATLAGSLCMLGFALAGSPALAYPTTGNYPAAVPTGYENICQLADRLSAGECVIVSDFPDHLTDAERFLLFGCDYATSASPAQWVGSELFTTLCNYLARTGEVPAAITDEVVETAWPELSGDLLEQQKELLRSPITGRYPRLDAKEFARGEMFVKVPSAEEIQAMAKADGNLKAFLDGHLPGDPNTPANLPNPIFYFRFYGEGAVIYTGLHYAY